MTRENFENLVKRALIKLPKHIREKMDNIAIVIKDNPSRDETRSLKMIPGNLLLGLYQGIPKTVWGRDFVAKLPDKITIFQGPIERMAQNKKDISELVRITVWHEIAHHFGFNEAQVRRLQKKWQRRDDIRHP